MFPKDITVKGRKAQIGEEKRQLRRNYFLSGLQLHFTRVTHPGLISTLDFFFLTGLLLLKKISVRNFSAEQKIFPKCSGGGESMILEKNGAASFC